MDLNKVKFDCRHFRGHIPCKPNKDYNADCVNCDYYDKTGKKILIIKLAAMGDVIRTTPLISALKKIYPDTHISWLTQFPDVLPQNEIDKIYSWNETSLFVLQNKVFDIAVNLDKEEEACILLDKVTAKQKYGFIWNNNHIDAATPAAEHKLLTGFFDHISIKNTKNYLQEIFEICHLKFNDEEYLLNYDKELAKKWRSKLEQINGGKKIIGLNTGCGDRWLTRLWPHEFWVKYIKLLQKNGFFPVVLGGPQEDEKNKKLAAETSCHYPGTYSLKEFFAITDACDMIVTQVSMMMHIATALQKKMILFNNIFNKNEFYLYNRGLIIEPESGCDCYYGNTCKREVSCMYDIKPEVVLEKTIDLLNQN